MNWFKKRNEYHLIKLFQLVDLNAAESFDIKKCFDICIEFLTKSKGNAPNFYSLNYTNKSWSSVERFKDELSKKKNDDLIFIYTDYNKDRSKAFASITNVMLNYENSPKLAPIQLELAFESDLFEESTLIKSLRDLYTIFQYNYGYCLKLTDDYNFVSEEKNKLFKGESINSSENMIWRSHIQAVNSGFIKKVYPINILNFSQLSQPIISNLIKEGVGRTILLEDEMLLWELNPNELKEVNKRFANTKWIISNTKAFLESPDSKNFFAKV